MPTKLDLNRRHGLQPASNGLVPVTTRTLNDAGDNQTSDTDYNGFTNRVTVMPMKIGFKTSSSNN